MWRALIAAADPPRSRPVEECGVAADQPRSTAEDLRVGQVDTPPAQQAPLVVSARPSALTAGAPVAVRPNVNTSNRISGAVLSSFLLRLLPAKESLKCGVTHWNGARSNTHTRNTTQHNTTQKGVTNMQFVYLPAAQTQNHQR